MTDERPTIDEDLAARSARLPFWRRPRRLRRQIAGTLVITALLAVVIGAQVLSVLPFFVNARFRAPLLPRSIG